MSNLSQFIRNEHQSLLTSRAAQAALLRSSRLVTSFIIVGLALFLGAVMAVMTMMPTSWMAVSVLAICATGGLLVWFWTELPLLPLLRFAFIFSFSFRLEINFFMLNKAHEAPPGINLSLTMILAFLLLVTHAADQRQQGIHKQVLPRHYIAAFALLFGWAILSVLYGNEWQLGLYSLLAMLTSWLIGYAGAACFRDAQALRQIVLATAVSVGCSGVIGVLQYFFAFATDWKILGAVDEEVIQHIAEGEISRVGGLQTMANAFGWYLVAFLPLLIAPLLLQAGSFRKWERWLVAAATGLGMIALILTYARGSWLSFAVSMPVLAALAWRATKLTERRKFFWRMAAVSVLLLFLALPFAPMIYTRLTEDDRGAAQSRIPLMEIAFTMIQDNPLLGVGLSAYETEQRRYDNTKEKILDDFDWPVHNVYLHITAEAGIPALLLLLALTGIAVWQAWLTLRCADPLKRALAVGLITALLAFMLTGLKELGSLGSSLFRIYFFLLGLMIAVRRIAEVEERKS